MMLGAAHADEFLGPDFAENPPGARHMPRQRLGKSRPLGVKEQPQHILRPAQE